jgi:mono/diheme cytochrome c family protein/DNA-binding beta-propeller fold protein YncE
MFARNSWLIGILTSAALGCSGPQQAGDPAKTASQHANSRTSGCARAHAAAVPVPLDGSSGSAVALVRAKDPTGAERTLAYVADADTSVLYTVDVDQAKELARTPLKGVPSQLLVHTDGRAIVALRDSSALQVLEPTGDANRALETRCEMGTPAEPVALALTPDRKTLLVSSGWGHALTALDAGSLATKAHFDLPREPRAIAVSDDGSRAFVSHAVGGRMSVVTLAGGGRAGVRSVWLSKRPELQHGAFTGEPANRRFLGRRFANQGFVLAKSSSPSGRILAPQVLVDRGDPERPTSRGYSESRQPQMPSIAVIDEDMSGVLASSVDDTPDPGANLAWGEQQTEECLLPRAAVVDPVTESLFVGCLGINSVVEYDAGSADPRRAERGRWDVPAGPTGVALDAAKRRLVVWSQFDRIVTLIPLAKAALGVKETEKKQRLLSLSRPSAVVEGANLALGRLLFHTTGNLKISADGRSCASCHVDGRDDGLTWATPDGPRQTPILVGRLEGTAPYGWNGNGKQIDDHMRKTFSRLGGSGLGEQETRALMAYVASLRAPVAPVKTEEARVARGKAVFQSPEVGCATCHGGEALTDGRSHDVGSKTTGDKATEFDTPSLLAISGSAPYFHDGRFSTLEEMLAATDGRMGVTSKLSASDRRALIAYLESL